MTRQRRIDGGTPFGLWLRKEPQIDSRHYGLSIQDVDHVVHRYQGLPYQPLMLLEEKQYGAESNFAQRDTLNILHQALQYAHGQTVRTMRGATVPFHYAGYHLVQFERTSPDDGLVWWNGRLIDRITLYRLLKFEIDPRQMRNARER